MSASLNTVAGTIYEDFVQLVFKGRRQSEAKQNLVTKFIVLILGVLCVALIFFVEKLSSLFQMATSLSGLTSGPLLGVFSLGLFCPKANAKGAKWGALGSLVVMAVVVFGTQYYEVKGLLKFPGKETSVEGCPANLTASLSFNASALVETFRGVGTPTVADESVPLIFHMCYMYYAFFGTLIVFLVGLPVSYLTDKPHSTCLDPKLFSPPIRRFLPKDLNSNNAKPNEPLKEEYILVSTNPDQDLKDSYTECLNEETQGEPVRFTKN